MKRIECEKRKEYRTINMSLGQFNNLYWKEWAYYAFSKEEIWLIKETSERLHKMYLETAKYLIDNDLLSEIWLEGEIAKKAKESFVANDFYLYWRFDFIFDWENIKLLEYNAQTPVSLIETSLIQLQWKEDLFPKNYQFNNLHHNLKKRWSYFPSESIDFSCYVTEEISWGVYQEDVSNVDYLKLTAELAGKKTRFIDTKSIEVVDWKFMSNGEVLKNLFLLVPYEYYDEAELEWTLVTNVVEPIWKIILQSKAFMAFLYKRYPKEKSLLRTEFTPFPWAIVSKPFYSREWLDIHIYDNGSLVEKKEKTIYQEYYKCPEFNEHRPNIWSWMIWDECSWIMVRESDSRVITSENCNFIPHIII